MLGVLVRKVVQLSRHHTVKHSLLDEWAYRGKYAMTRDIAIVLRFHTRLAIGKIGETLSFLRLQTGALVRSHCAVVLLFGAHEAAHISDVESIL